MTRLQKAGAVIALGVLALLLVAGPLVGQTQQTYVQTGFEHAATKAFYSAGTYLLLRDLLGMKKEPAALLSTVGLWATAKAVMMLKHPTWVGPWTAGDFAHDLAWHALIVGPVAFGPRQHPWRAGVSLVGLGAGVMLTRSWSLPSW